MPTIRSLKGVTALESFTPLAVSDTAIGAAFAGNNATNNWPAVNSPDVARYLKVVFAASWDGGDVTVYGIDIYGATINEVFTSTPGSTVNGTKAFRTVTGAQKGAVGVTANTASIGTQAIVCLTNGSRDILLLVSAANGALTVMLPPVAILTPGRRIELQKIDAVANITIDADAAETINGSATVVLNTQYTGASLIANSTAWVRLVV